MKNPLYRSKSDVFQVELAGKDIVFRFIIEYSSSLRDFGP